MKIAIFDFDGTLLDGETIENILKDEPEKYHQMKELNQKGVQGLVDFTTLYLQKINLLKGISRKTVSKNLRDQTYMEGAQQLIRHLKNLGYKVIVMSGAFEEAIQIAQKNLGFDLYYCNTLIYDENDCLTGQVVGPCMTIESKGDLVRKIRCLFDDDLYILACGDGRNDVSLFEEANFSVAYHSRCVALRDIAKRCIEGDENWYSLIDKIV